MKLLVQKALRNYVGNVGAKRGSRNKMSKRSEITQNLYSCPQCGVKAVNLADGRHIQTLQCMACGWSMSVNQWNAIPLAEKRKMYAKHGLKI